MCVPSSSGGRPPQAPPVVSTRGAPFHLRSPNRALWASPSPPVGLRLGDLRGGPRLAAGPRLGGRTCPRQSQLASQLLNFPSRALRPPLRQHPCLSIRSAHPHPPLARGGRDVKSPTIEYLGCETFSVGTLGSLSRLPGATDYHHRFIFCEDGSVVPRRATGGI